MARNYQNIRTAYWDSARGREAPLSSDEILVELFLITSPQCGPSGIFIINPETVGYYTGLGHDPGQSRGDIFGNGKIEGTLRALESKGRLRLYPGGWIWVMGKWEFEAKNPNIQKALFIEVESAPGEVIRDFLDRYRQTFTERIPERILQRASRAVRQTLPETVSETVPETVTGVDPEGTPLTKVEVEENRTNLCSASQTRSASNRSKQHPESLMLDDNLKGWVCSLIPELENNKSALKRNLDALEKLFRLDREKICPHYGPEQWKAHVIEILEWMAHDTEGNGKWKGWASVFSSIPRLRQNGCEKFISARRSFLSRNPQRDITSDIARLEGRIISLEAQAGAEPEDELIALQLKNARIELSRLKGSNE